MKMQLKKGQPSFEMVEGPFARQRFVPGKVYEKAEIPEGELARFTQVKTAPKKERKEKTA